MIRAIAAALTVAAILSPLAVASSLYSTGKTRSDAPPVPLQAERLYHGVGRPLMIAIEKPDGEPFLSLALLDAEGASLAAEQPVRPGRADLSELFPQLRDLERAAYVQLLHDGEAVGSALVVQPLLTRLVPQTEPSFRADGTPYTRITGWKHELSEPPRSPPTRQAGEPTNEANDASPQEDAASDDKTGSSPTPPRVLSGWRVYPDQDVALHTSKGEVRLAMRPDHAPNTVWNFLELCRGGFYREVIFHRIVPLTATGDPFVIQAGDPSAHGSGGPGWWLPIEPSELPHDFGVISMARADHPDSAGSQFFICLSRSGTARLDGQYCSFGYAVEGAKTILDIAASELADPSRGRAKISPVIRRTELIAAPPRTSGAGRPDARVTPELADEHEPSPPPRVPR